MLLDVRACEGGRWEQKVEKEMLTWVRAEDCRCMSKGERSALEKRSEGRTRGGEEGREDDGR